MNTRRDEIGVRNEVERDEHGHRLIDCVGCDRKRTPQGAFGLCYTCYRREKRMQKRKTHMNAQGQQKEQIRLTKLYSQMMTAAISLGMDEDDIRQLQMLLQPYLRFVPRLLNTAWHPTKRLIGVTDERHEVSVLVESLLRTWLASGTKLPKG